MNSNKSKTVLIVEDEIFNYVLIKELLADYNFEFLHAYNGKEAVEICKSNPDINLIFMDIKMAVMDGVEATRLIKEFRPNLPIVAQTAYALKHEILKLRGQGFDEYVPKPLKEEKIIEIIDKYLK